MATAPKRRQATKKVGRPTKYDPSLCEAIVAFCAEGYSITAFAGSIGVARSTIQEWEGTYPEFSVAVKSAKAASAYWWETRGRKVAERGGGPGTATMIIFSLKNMAPDDFADRQNLELTGKDGGAIQTEEITARDILSSRIAGLAARNGKSGSDPESN
jgi:hypothetical protein